jgi:Xaa-Pro dipeptidase
VDAACRAVIDRHDLYHYYRKRAGYSVGTGFASWMENAIANLQGNDRTELRPGMCFHLPIAMRLYGEATMGISETVLITDAGAEKLHQSPRDFFAR